jgi:hypothetical protein
MRVTKEMGFLQMEDIAGFAEARFVAKLLRDVAAAAPAWAERATVERLENGGATLAVLVADALRAPDFAQEMRRLRQAAALVAELREHAWAMHRDGMIAAPMLDEIMRATARCGAELDKLRVGCRRRVLERLAGR